MNLKLAAFAAFFLFYASLSFANNIIDPVPYKKSALSYCSKERPGSFRKDCLVLAGENLNFIRQADKTPAFSQIVSLCSSATDMNSSDALYHVSDCIKLRTVMGNQHIDPKWLNWQLRRSELRSNWVGNCFATVGNKVSRCVQKQELGFSLFWSDYLSAKDKTTMGRIERCIRSPFQETDFALYISCR
jgi:hypothetical protein